MRFPLRSALFHALLLVWLLMVVAVFVVANRIDPLHILILPGSLPLGIYLGRIAPAVYFLDLLRALLGITVFSYACFSLGLLLTPAGNESHASRFGVATTSFLIGESLFSVIFLSSIVLYRLTPCIVGIALVLAILAAIPKARRFVVTSLSARFGDGLDKPNRIVLVLTFIVMALALLYSSSRLGYDSVVEYFSHAKLMAMTQSAVYSFPKDVFPVSSFHSTILYTAVIELFGDQAARLLSWINGLAIVLLIVAIGHALGLTPRARLYAVAMTLTTTVLVDLLGDGKVDLISTALLLAAAHWMIDSYAAPSKRAYALIGGLLGFAMISRAFNAFLAPVFALAFYAVREARRRWGSEKVAIQYFRTAVWILLPIIAIGLFHLWQNAEWLGDWFAPLKAAADLGSLARQGSLDPVALRLYRLLYPFTATFDNTSQSGGTITPLFLGLLPLLLVSEARASLRRRPALLGLVAVLAATLLLWIVVSPAVVEIRYVLFLWLLLYLPIAQMMDSLSEENNGRLRRLANILPALLLAYVAGRVLVVAVTAYSPIDSGGQAHCYDLSGCTFLESLNRTAGPGERVFVVNAYRYYLRPDLFACSSRAEEYLSLESLAKENSPNFWRELYRRGFKYITYDTYYAVNHMGFGLLPPTITAVPWLQVTQVSASRDGLERIYRIAAVNPPIEPESDCQRDQAGVWQVKFGSPLQQP